KLRTLQKDRELVTLETRDDGVTRRSTFRARSAIERTTMDRIDEACCHIAEQPLPGGLPHGVGDALEPVESEREDSEGTLMRATSSHGSLEKTPERCAAREVRQLVEVDEVVGPTLRLAELGDVLDDADQARARAILVLDELRFLTDHSHPS